ncbi:dolichyl-diphosphooligosaccharide--protein glycosyltransferase subunit 2 [Patescibacteria group bacterium]|nr:dolichyl-diphosphooligosaccharide--protein glycosyltransferase subunit 2 [Patescibacteria group bacterium]
MKRIFYIISFSFLGLLLQILVHALIEILYIGLLVGDYNKYALGFSWGQLVLIHHIGTVILVILGLLFGFWQGKYWWKRLYEDKK